MDNSKLEKEVIDLVGSRYTNLSEVNRKILLEFYEKKSKTIVPAIICWFFSVHYLYFHKWFVFIVFIVTLMGLGIWWVIDLFRINTILNKYNEKLLIDFINNIDNK